MEKIIDILGIDVTAPALLPETMLAGDTMFWFTDSSGINNGWEICFIELDDSFTPTTPTSGYINSIKNIV